MNYLFVCNTGSDTLSQINLNNFKEEKCIRIAQDSERYGPHGLCKWKDNIITANSYNSSLSIIDVLTGKVIEECYIGGNCNDVAVYNYEAIIVCGESNNLIVFDLENKRIVEEIPIGNLPHSIDINYELDLMAVTNMENSTLSILRCSNKELIKNISVGCYPTKAFFSEDNNYIFLCESYLGHHCCGFINIISTKSLCSVGKIAAGYSPIDLCFEGNILYVANFCEGLIQVIDLKKNKITKRIFVGGMPRCIKKKERYIFIGDNYGARLFIYDSLKDEKKSLSIGKEPTDMTLY